MMRKQKTTFVERLLGGERRPPFQRGRGAAGKLENLGGGDTGTVFLDCLIMMMLMKMMH